MQICKNWIFYRKIQLYSKNVCKKIIHLWKALDNAISNMQKFLKILNNLIFNQEKLKMCKFPLTGCLPKICNFFFAKLVQSVSLCHRLSKKLNFINIWQVKVGQNKDLVCYRQKQSFRQCAWVRKFQQPAGIIFGSIICRFLFIAYNMEPVNYTLSTFLSKYFLSYVKKNYRRGVKFNPLPPSGIGLTIKFFLF